MSRRWFSDKTFFFWDNCFCLSIFDFPGQNCNFWKKFRSGLVKILWQACQSCFLRVQMNVFRQNIFLLRQLFLLISLWFPGIRLWLLEKISVRFVSNLLYVSLETTSRKNHFFKTVLHFHPSHLTRKKSNLEEGYSVRLSKFHSTWSKEGFQENLFCFVKNYMFSSLLEIQTKLLDSFWKKYENYLHWIIFVEWNVIAEVFHFERKYIPIIFFGLWQTKFQNPE